MTTAHRTARRLFRRFARDDRGNIAAIFAISLVPMIGLVGTAIDYSRAASARSAMQAALDSTVLMASKIATQVDAATLTRNAQNYFKALYHGEAGDISLNISYNQAGGGKAATLTATTSGKIDTAFMRMFGSDTVSVGTESTVTWASSRMRVALALDNTGSMDQGNKMPALKTAAKNLVKALSDGVANADDLYISVIPFAKDVNVGTSNVGANWLDWTDWEKDNQTCDKRGRNCQPMARSKWNGCVTDRTQPHDTTMAAPSGAARFPTEQADACPQPLLPLTNNWSTVKKKIDDMTPNGGTNQPIGLAWAWWTLNDTAPFAAPARSSDVKYTDVIILLTDGLNTQDRWPSYGNGQRQINGQIDARQKILCDNIKAAGVILYTIQVNTDGEAKSTVLPYCASSPEKFFFMTSASQIGDTFVSIGDSLSKLRISQ